MKAKFRHSLLAVALALGTQTAFAQNASSPFTQTVFFGDSLTDAGFYRPFLIQTAGPSAAIIGQFTTNPGYVYAQYLADYYGTNADPAWTLTTTGIVAGTGTNYAAGGARVDTVGGYPPIQPIINAPPISAQISAYLGRNASVDRNALYTVFAGANDLLYHVNGFTTQATFLAAAGQEVTQIARLANAGAQYIMVVSLPDVGKTPTGLSQGPAVSAGLGALASAYNGLLYGGLAAANIRVIPLDTFNFLREVTASPALYGFRNVTSAACTTESALTCNPGTLVAPDAPQTYAFADGNHPTPATHKLLADYAISVIEGPRQIAILPHSEAVVGRARAHMIDGAIAGIGKEDGMRWWANVGGVQQRYGAPFHYDGFGPSASFGIGWTSGNLVYGAFAGYGRQDHDFGLRRGDFQQTDAGLGGFIGWRGDGLWANAQLGWTKVSYEVDRAVQLGPATRVHSGSPDGDNLSIGASTGWSFEHGALKHGPVLSILSQQISVDGYAETDLTLSTSLAFPQQDVDSLIGSVGWQLSYVINGHLKPYAKVTYDREFEDAPEHAFAQAQSIPGTLPYAVPGLPFDTTYGTVSYGVRSELFGLDITTGSSLTVGQKGGDDSSFFLTVSNKF